MGIRQLALHLINSDRTNVCHWSGVLEAAVLHGRKDQRPCE